jgi:hypothetical protein
MTPAGRYVTETKPDRLPRKEGYALIMKPFHPTPEHLIRLALVRQLLRLAEDQSAMTSPARCLALLSMHDAVEMLLDLIAELAGIQARKMEFKDYWKALAGAASPIDLPLARPMEKLNQARVALKHHGHRPSDDQLMSHLANTKLFLSEATEDCFGRPLATISMAALVKDDKVRDLIDAAIASMQAGDLRTALESTASAFWFGSAGVANIAQSPRFSDLAFIPLGSKSPFADVAKQLGLSIKREVQNHANRVHQMIMLLSFGIDLRENDRFRSIVPTVRYTMSGKRHITWTRALLPTVAEVEVCIDFVINFMLSLEAHSKS